MLRAHSKETGTTILRKYYVNEKVNAGRAEKLNSETDDWDKSGPQQSKGVPLEANFALFL
jgi:hypothetical protein